MGVWASILFAAVGFAIGYAMAKEHFSPHIDYEKVIREKEQTIKELRGELFEIRMREQSKNSKG